MGLRHLQVAVWAVCLASAGGALADPQKVSVYKSANPTDHNPANATAILKTVPIREISNPIGGGTLTVWGKPECRDGASVADCTAAKQVWSDVQAASVALGEDRMGDDAGVLHVIIMDKANPDGFNGYYVTEHDSIILYPGARPGDLAHEVAHADFDKNVGVGSCNLPCSEAGIKKWGVNEGLAEIVAYHVTPGRLFSEPSADNVADVLAGNNCLNKLGTAAGASGCAHDLGHLVLKAYRKAVAEIGADGAFDVYMKARLRLSTVTPATLHQKVGDILEEQAPSRIPIPLPDIRDPFNLLLWEAWLVIFEVFC